MEKNSTYHIFISYRRSCSEQNARILQLALQKAGYDVFLDYDDLNNNNTFTYRIRKVIENTPIFILLLAPNAFERCSEGSDIMRMEIEHAIATERTIIPVNFDKSFKDFPATFPVKLRNKISSHNYAEITSGGQTFNYIISGFIKDRIYPIVGDGKSGKYRKEEDENVCINSNEFRTIASEITKYELGKVFYVLGDFYLAFYWYAKSADEGNADAQYELANCYTEGKGVAQSYDKAVYWYIKSAEQNHVGAQYKLADCYYYGRGVEQNLEKAIGGYIECAVQGNADAQYKLANCYVVGKGKKQSYDKAVYWYTKSAEQGNVVAQYELANSYYFGKGVKESYERAVYWYTKSAEQGNVDAQYELARCYYLGRGVEKNYDQAVYWYARSVNKCEVGEFEKEMLDILFGGKLKSKKSLIDSFKKIMGL